MKYKTKEEVLIKSKDAIGKSFGDLDNEGKLSNIQNKGNLGQIIEEEVFQYKINSVSKPDFIEAEVELKVTPYKINKNGTISAKERLVLNIINYIEEVKNSFYSSSFWVKNKTLLIMYYLYEFDKNYKDMQIHYTFLHEFEKTKDLNIIINDYQIILKKILDGKAHEISEADTMYLAACTKGANKNSLRNQPFSNIKAPQRAFSLKQSYMTAILRDYVNKQKNISKYKLESLVKGIDNDYISLEEYITKKVSKYYNIPTIQLMKDFNIKSKAKSIRAIIISKMLKVNNISKTEEFIKSGMMFKTIHVNNKGNIKESMSFPHFDFCELIKENWENSNIRNIFLTTKFVFAIFKDDSNGIEKFNSIIFWRMPEKDLENEYRKIFEKTKKVLIQGNIIKEIKIKNGRKYYYTNFPNSTNSYVGHVRPHATNRNDTLKLPFKDKLTGKEYFTKQCFWLNSNYIKSLIKKSQIII